MSSRLELWGDELQRTEPPRDPQQAEQALSAHNESVARMQHATFQVGLHFLIYHEEMVAVCPNPDGQFELFHHICSQD